MPYLGNEVAPLVQALEGKELKLDSDGDSSITADTDDRVDVKVGGSDIAHVTSTGLGVGTTSPSHELHITGSSDTRAIITSGGSGDAVMMFENASGNTWGHGLDLSSSNYAIAYNASGDPSLTADGKVNIDTSGNVGIGKSSPDSKLNIETTKTTALSSEAHFTTLGLCIDDNTAYNTALAGGGIAFRHIKNSSGDMNVYGAIDGVRTDNANGRVGGHLRFFTNNDGDGIPTERMRIDSSGNLFVGTTSLPSGGNGGFGVEAGQSSGRSIVQCGATATGNLTIQRFYNPNGSVGSITVSGTSTGFNTSSDYRLKENVVTDWDATSRLKQLKPSRFNFKADKDTTLDGFIAHEVSSVVPEAISGEKDAVDKDGNIEPQSIDQAKLVPLLTKALQEAIAKIEILEAKVTALESK